MTEQRKRWRSPAKIQVRARQLRREQTPAEARLWRELRGQQVEGLNFRRQHPMGSYVLDFYCPAARLVIEVDGDTHADRKGYDAERTEWLQERGYQVIRFSNREVCENLEAVVEEIERVASECIAAGAPPLSPPRYRGGEGR